MTRRRESAPSARSGPSRGAGRLTAAIAVVVLSAGVTLLVAEGALRLAGYPFRATWSPSENALARFDPELGWSYRPDHSGTVTPFGGEAPPVEVAFDRFGSRVARPGEGRDPGAPSVLLIGGSLTMGHGLRYEDTFGARLEAIPDFPLQPVNLGVQAFGTDQALLMLERHLETFDTRAVVYTYVSDHVVRNSIDDRRYLYRGARVLGTKPLFRVDPAGRPVLARRPVRARDLRYSRVAAALRLAMVRLLPPPGPELTRALVREMQRLTEAHGATFLVVHVIQSSPMSARGPAVFDGTAIDVIDTSAAAPDGWNDWVIPGDGHPDARANARIAELIAARLRERGAW